MATWTTIPNTSIETDKPIRAVDGRALRDNVTALAEGANGAPRVEAQALDTTTDERDWVAARYGEVGEATSIIDAPIGIILMLRYDGNSSLSTGDTTDGSNLVYSNGDGGSGSSDGPDSGTTWRCLGFAFRDGVAPGDTNPGLRTTIFIRTA